MFFFVAALARHLNELCKIHRTVFGATERNKQTEHYVEHRFNLYARSRMLSPISESSSFKFSLKISREICNGNLTTIWIRRSLKKCPFT